MTTASPQTISKAWKTFQRDTGNALKPPKTETEYEALTDLLQNLTDRYNCNQEPYASLFDLLAKLALEWELDNEPELQLAHLEPFERLKFLMERRGVTQVQLEEAGIAAQANLSAMRKGKLGISKAVAKRLAAYFGVSVETFI